MKNQRFILISILSLMSVVIIAQQNDSIQNVQPKAIDLGLRVKWADKNLGAVDSLNFGSYYAWGELQTKDKYDEASYRFISGDTITKYCNSELQGLVDNKFFLDSIDDVAHVMLGDSWFIPSRKHIAELLRECSWERVIIDSINVLKFLKFPTSSKAVDEWVIKIKFNYYAILPNGKVLQVFCTD